MRGKIQEKVGHLRARMKSWKYQPAPPRFCHVYFGFGVQIEYTLTRLDAWRTIRDKLSKHSVPEKFGAPGENRKGDSSEIIGEVVCDGSNAGVCWADAGWNAEQFATRKNR